MTKCIVIGEEYKSTKRKTIEFVYLLRGNGNFVLDFSQYPSNFSNLELIQRDFHKGEYKFDLIFAYNDKRENGYIYLGHWNDGIV
jgi:hypothetical protein